MNKSNVRVPFHPAVGKERTILAQDPREGWVWFATDSKKIYYSNGEAHLPMGGNSSVFYGVRKFGDEVDAGQTEFTFGPYDIDGNAELDANSFKIPNVDDLILNQDGCFYRVTSIDGTAEDIEIFTTKLTIAGTGNGPSSDPSTGNVGTITLDRITQNGITCLYNRPFTLKFFASAVDASGDQTGNGTYEVEINGIRRVLTGTCKQGENSVEIGSKLNLGANKVRVYITMDIGGSNPVTISKLWDSITTTQIELKWNYVSTILNDINNPFNINFSVTGSNIEKTVYVTVNDVYELPAKTFKSTSNQTITLNPKDYGHGAHKVHLRAVATVDGQIIDDIPTVTKNVIFVDYDSNEPIISCNFFERKIQQYTAVQIPVLFYSKENGASTMSATLKENDTEVDTWDNIVNGQTYTWNYTPLVSYPPRELKIFFGTAYKTLRLEIDPVNIENEEISGAAFTIKANSYASNTALQNDSLLTFSDNFDWVNGGIKSELDEKGNPRQYICVKTGSTMTINHKLFEKNIAATGKTFKIIFKATGCRDYDAQVLSCYENEKGLLMRAQNAIFRGSNNILDIPYCEDSYIEFEFDVTGQPDVNPLTNEPKRYMMAWLDGVPTVFKRYAENESFLHNPSTAKNIVIGSNDCDVWVYLVKAYDRHLEDGEHLSNFIADAPNAQEMLDRYNRNDIMDPERPEVISPTRLAEKNPDCRVHVYDISRMTLNKKDPVSGCSYVQYHGSSDPVLSADNVTIKVQGTSSAAYGLAAFNLDSEFTEGFKYPDGTTSEGWSMNPDSLPVNYFCTKVNVASAEQTNNAMLQEWYNRYQPYKTQLRHKNPKARDTMEFVPGVLFIKDRNKQCDFDNADKAISNNVFAEIDEYVNDPYDRMYSICNMGNSKDNTSILHDTTNPIEYCVEVTDNQKPLQWMVHCDYEDSLWAADDTPWEFRYPDKAHKNLDNTTATFTSPLTDQPVTHRQHAFDAWRRFITWMAESNPQPAYQNENVSSNADLAALRNKVSTEIAAINLAIAQLNEKISNAQVDINNIKGLTEEEDLTEEQLEQIAKYQAIIDEATEKLAEQELLLSTTAAEIYTAKLAGDGIESDYTLLAADASYDASLAYFTKTVHTSGYTLKPLPADVTKDFANFEFKNETYSANLLGTTVSTYAGHYTHDTYEYRMAKMLSECENYLVMDSVLFHYLFIERHTMVDNVAKNTFWSTEDGFHWNLTKDYDNDTADGNDNQGKLTLHYGIEPTDKAANKFYFNAVQSVWLQFCSGLYPAAKALYNKLESCGPNGTENAWDDKAFLDACSEWQKTIPERCWIEDYYRKYVRPLEIYGDEMFVDMMEGGQKVHQRKQYETYQNYYMSSKYYGKTASDNKIIIRGNGEECFKDLPVSVYADCYIQIAFGSGQTPNYSKRVKRNTPIMINPTGIISTMNNSTVYFYLPQLYQTIGALDKASLNSYLPEQITLSAAKKLRTLIAGQYQEKALDGTLLKNETLESVGFQNNDMLEELHMCNYFPTSGEVGEQEGGASATLGDLDLSNAVNLKHLDVRDSGFTAIKIASGAPIEKLYLGEPNTINLSKLKHLDTLTFGNPAALKTIITDDIDNSPINSKTHLVDIATSFNTKPTECSYRLKNVQWTIDKLAGEIDTTNKKITVLEKLLKTIPFTDQTMVNAATHAESLTGELTITAALDSAVAKSIYEYYSLAEKLEDVKYPNLTINFTNAGLHTVTILGGNGKPIWEGKFVHNYAAITEDDLKVSPYGAFDATKITKPSTELVNYIFSKQWKIYVGDDPVPQTVDGDPLPAITNIVDDIVLEPIFSEESRIWEVTIHHYDPDATGEKDQILTHITNCPAGWTLRQIQQEYGIPYKDGKHLDLTETYSFTGYTLTSSSTNVLDLDEYTITGDTNLYTLFEIKSVYDNIHLDYFDFEWSVYDDYDGEYDTAYQVADGYIAYLKNGIGGKITIPATYNNKPVWGVAAYGMNENYSVTHVFVGRTKSDDPTSTNLRMIGGYAFNNYRNLEYFDFPYASLRSIKDGAFSSTPNLKPNYDDHTFYFGDIVKDIGENAFNWSLNFNGEPSVDLIFSEKLEKLGSSAFSYLASEDSGGVLNIYIGSVDKPSPLDLNRGLSDTAAYECFRLNQDRQIIGVVQFYSSVYNSWDDIVNPSVAKPEVKYWLGLDWRKPGAGNWELNKEVI